MDMMTSKPWLIPLRDINRVPLLLMGIHGICQTIGLPMTMIITTTMALIAIELVATTLTLGPGVLCIWVTPALLSQAYHNSSI